MEQLAKEFLEALEDIVRTVGVVSIGKERWFINPDGSWHDRVTGEVLTIQEMTEVVCSEIMSLDD